MRSRSRWLLALLLAGCGSAVEQTTTTSGTGDTSDSTGGASSTSAGAGGACDWQQCSCGAVYCGSCAGCDKPCDPADLCPEKFWCDYPDDLCGKGQKGVCRVLPAGCGETPPPFRVCGCDGQVRSTDCANIGGHDVSADALLCSDGTFACGALSCKRYVEYCETVLPGVGGAPTYACKATACTTGIADCACMPGIPPGACVRGSDGQVRVTLALP